MPRKPYYAVCSRPRFQTNSMPGTVLGSTEIRISQEFDTPDSDTAGIQEAIDDLPAGGGCVLIPPGTHVMDMTVQILDRQNITIMGAGPGAIVTIRDQLESTVTQDELAGQPVIHVSEPELFNVGQYVALRDSVVQHGECYRIIDITGNALTLNQNLLDVLTLADDPVCMDGGVLIHLRDVASSHITIKDLTVNGNRDNYAVWTTYPCAYNIMVGDYAWSRCFSVINCHLTEFRGAGISMHHSDRSQILNCTIDHGNGLGITAEAGNDYALVDGNFIDDCYGGVKFTSVMWLVISNNIIKRVTGPSETGIFIGGAANQVIISSNHIDGYENGIEIIASGINIDYDFVISNNVIYNCYANGMWIRPLIGTAALNNLNITGNIIGKCRQTGIIIYGCDAVVISNNQIRECNTSGGAVGSPNSHGILLGYTLGTFTNTIVHDNIITNLGTGHIKYGIWLYNANTIGAIIHDNIINGCEVAPIQDDGAGTIFSHNIT